MESNERTIPHSSMLSLGEVAARLGISLATTRRLVADGALPAHRIRGQIRIAVGDLASYLDANRLAPVDTPANAEGAPR
jgi:excisionase family DNA binding protein